MNEITKILGAALAVSGALTAGAAFLNQAESIERRGLTLVGGVALIGLGLVFLNKLDDATIKTKRLLA